MISSLHSWDSRVRDQRVLPAVRVGITNRGTIRMPRVASSQFCRYMTTTATIRVILLERISVRVLVMTRWTPSMSLVMRVMISPWLLVVKKRWDISCRWRYMLLRMS